MTHNDPGSDRKRITFFDGSPAAGLGELMSPAVYEPGVLEKVGSRLPSLAAVLTTTVLFSSGTDGFSLVQLEARGGAVLPTHHHDLDCLYYVVEGEIRIGSRTLASGAGFFVPANTRYAYEAGPDGAKVIEFRASSRFGMTITETSEAKWDRLLTAAERHQADSTA